MLEASGTVVLEESLDPTTVADATVQLVGDPPADRHLAFVDGGEARFIRAESGDWEVRLLNPRAATWSQTPLSALVEVMETLAKHGELL